jgi:hypothetical protein
MGRSFGTIVLVVAGLFSLFTAWSSGTAPAKFAEQLGLSISNFGGVNEVRAQYAGFFFAIALACAGSLAGLIPRQSSFLVLVLVFGGLLAGRLVSLALNGGTAGYSPSILALYAIDFVGLALCLSAMIADRTVQP